MTLSRKHSSLWIATAPGPSFSSLPNELSNQIEVDVAVLGAGMAGVTTATLLKQAGLTVAVVESGRIARGVTGQTTAKVTSNHRLIYADLIGRYGEEVARQYAEANQAALECIARLVEEQRIGCDFERRPSYTYAESESDVDIVEKEVEAAQRVGLPARLVHQTYLPYPVAAAITYDNQAQFHPVRYLQHLIERIPGDGSHVFEGTRALDVEEGSPNLVITNRGAMRARDVVIATHFPFLNRGMMFTRIHPYREYVVCARIDATQDLQGMYINVSDPVRSVRAAPAPQGRYLVIAGEKHRTGQEPDTVERYRKLEEFARSRFGVGDFEYQWSTQDNYSVDRLPYIGLLQPGSKHLYVATGFNAWGMTLGTLAGMIICDLITDKPNPWAELCDPRRLRVGGAARRFVQENISVAQRFFGDRLAAGARPADQILPGDGDVVDVEGELLAISKDEQGAMHTVSPYCTHLGCVVSWNRAEQSWDCPCHGSRFGPDGSIYHGPAVRDLKSKEMPAE